MKAIWLLTAGALLSGCVEVPDFMVEGRLPHFGDKAVETASQPAPAVADAKPEAEAPPAPAATAPTPAPAPAPTIAAVSRITPMPKPVKPAEAKPIPAPLPTPVEVMPSPPLAGGFSPLTDKAEAERIAAFAVHESPGYVLKGIKSVRTQVVAGMNYDLCLKVRTPGHEASWIHQRYVKARVFQGLDQHMELVSWQEVEGCE